MKAVGNQKDTVLEINEAILPPTPRGIARSLGAENRVDDKSWGGAGEEGRACAERLRAGPRPCLTRLAWPQGPEL